MRTASEFPHNGIIHLASVGEEIFQSYPLLLQETTRQVPLVQSTSLDALLYKPNETRIDLDRRSDLKFGFRQESPE